MQSNRVRLMLVVLLGVFAFSAVATATAQAEEAPFWSVGGARLEEGKTHYTTTKIYDVTGKENGFTMSAAGKSIHCESVRLKEGVFLGSSAGNPGTTEEIIELFGGCTVTNNGSSCKPVEPIVTNNLKSELVETEKGEKGSLLTELKPETGVRIMTLHFEGTCTQKETFVEGELAGQVRTDPNNGELGELVTLPNGKKEAHSWLLNFPAEPIKEVWLIKEGTGSRVKLKELRAASEPATIVGTVLGLLAKKNSSGGFESEEVNWSPLP
jgi:hypothetical protein